MGNGRLSEESVVPGYADICLCKAVPNVQMIGIKWHQKRFMGMWGMVCPAARLTLSRSRRAAEMLSVSQLKPWQEAMGRIIPLEA